MDICDVGDVFRDKHDHLWKCVMATDSNVVLKHVMGTKDDKVLPRSLLSEIWRTKRLIFCWNENSPGVIQTSKDKPAYAFNHRFN